MVAEAERIKAVKKYEILDTPPDGSFDHITSLAAELLQVPIAIITIVDTDRIWFKSSVGLEVTQIDRSPGLCASAILTDDIYIVENARTDPRTLANPLVAGEMGLRFYAAIPLKVNSGHNLGTLCIIDKEPRTLSLKEEKILKNLGEILVDQLELRLSARESNRKQSELLNIVAHELKNPLTTIPVYAGLIRDKSVDRPEIMSMCIQIHKASEKMNVLITDMLENAKLQTKELRLKKTNFDLGVVVGRICSLNLVLANAKQQKVFLDISESALVHADEMRMGEVIDNILNNAIKYSPRGAEISVKLNCSSRYARVEIADQGPGFTNDDKEKMFQPFTKLSAKPTNGEISTGLGLSVVKLLVDAHNGNIQVLNNATGKGASIIIEIPLAI